MPTSHALTNTDEGRRPIREGTTWRALLMIVIGVILPASAWGQVKEHVDTIWPAPGGVLPSVTAACQKTSRVAQVEFDSFASANPKQAAAFGDAMRKLLNADMTPADTAPKPITKEAFEAMGRGQKDSAMGIIQRAVPAQTYAHMAPYIDDMFNALGAFPDSLRMRLVANILACQP